jgi:hypothetical protein
VIRLKNDDDDERLFHKRETKESASESCVRACGWHDDTLIKFVYVASSMAVRTRESKHPCMSKDFHFFVVKWQPWDMDTITIASRPVARDEKEDWTAPPKYSYYYYIYRVTVKSWIHLFCLYILRLKEHRKHVTARLKLRLWSLCEKVENVDSVKKNPLWLQKEKLSVFTFFNKLFSARKFWETFITRNALPPPITHN